MRRLSPIEISFDVNKRNVQCSKCHLWSHFPIYFPNPKIFLITKPLVIRNNSIVNFDSLLGYFGVKINHWYNILDLLVVLFNLMDTKGMFCVKFFVSVKTSNGISGIVLATFSLFFSIKSSKNQEQLPEVFYENRCS